MMSTGCGSYVTDRVLRLPTNHEARMRVPPWR